MNSLGKLSRLCVAGQTLTVMPSVRLKPVEWLTGSPLLRPQLSVGAVPGSQDLLIVFRPRWLAGHRVMVLFLPGAGDGGCEVALSSVAQSSVVVMQGPTKAFGTDGVVEVTVPGSLPVVERDRHRGRFQSRGVLVRQSVSSSLVSVAGLVGAPVRDLQSHHVGRLVDVVVRWDRGVYPQVSGLVIRIGSRRAFVHVADVSQIGRRAVQLGSTRVDLTDFQRRSGEQLLRKDVIDHQLLDVDGARVVRAADLYVCQVGARYWVVGVDVSIVSFLRRLLPARMGSLPTAERVLDFASIQPFGRPGAPVKLRKPHRGLERLRPADLADLLEDLGRPERRELLSLLPPESAADVLEEMEPRPLRLLLQDVPSDQAAGLLAMMEPDEAVDALRDLSEEDRLSLLAQMPQVRASELRLLLTFPEGVAGGIMTTKIVVLHMNETIGDARLRVRARRREEDVDGLVVIDDDGRLVDDVSLMDLLDNDPDTAIGAVLGPPFPGTVLPDADLDDVVEQLIGNRGASLVVVDLEHRPIGRILADDVVDALVSSQDQRRWPWQPKGSAG